MSFTYTMPWATTRDYVRFLVADTDAASPIRQDEELDGALAQWDGDARLAAADVLEAMAGEAARQAISWSVAGVSVNRTQIADILLRRAEALRDAAMKVPFELESVVDQSVDSAGIDWSNYPMSPDGDDA